MIAYFIGGPYDLTKRIMEDPGTYKVPFIGVGTRRVGQIDPPAYVEYTYMLVGKVHTDQGLVSVYAYEEDYHE